MGIIFALYVYLSTPHPAVNADPPIIVAPPCSLYRCGNPPPERG